MGTLATVLAGKEIQTTADRYRAEVTGNIEDVAGVLKITRIHVHFYIKTADKKKKEATEALQVYISKCPAAQSVIHCIDISHELTFET